MSEKTLGFLMAGTTAVCWSILAIALKFSLGYAGSGTIVWFRMTVAALVIATIFSFKRRHYLGIIKKPPLLAILGGICLAANYYGYMKGIELTSASNAQVLIQLSPLLLALVGVFYFKEKLSPIQWGGVLVAICGFVAFYWSQMHIPNAPHKDLVGGSLWMLVAIFTWASFASFQKILTQKSYNPQQINLVIYIVSAIALAPSAHFNELNSLGFWGWVLMIILGLNTVIAYGALGEALKRIPAAYVSMIICMNPLLTIALLKLLEFLELDWVSPEPLDGLSYFGAFCVVFGVAIALSLPLRSRVQS